MARIEIPRPEQPSQIWAIDFAHDSLSIGRKTRILPIIDTFTHECLTICVDTLIGGRSVTSIFNEVAFLRGLPQIFVVDHDPEFMSNDLDEWACARGVTLNFIRVGKPIENACIKSFIGQLWDECLNVNWFLSINHARQVIEKWRRDYNQ